MPKYTYTTNLASIPEEVTREKELSQEQKSAVLAKNVAKNFEKPKVEKVLGPNKDAPKSQSKVASKSKSMASSVAETFSRVKRHLEKKLGISIKNTNAEQQWINYNKSKPKDQGQSR